MATTNELSPNSIFFLDLVGPSGTVNLIHALPNQRLTLKTINVTFDSAADSLANGEFLNVSLSFFSHVRINSNRTRQIEALPVFNDVSSANTHYSPDIEVDTDSSAIQSFEYSIYRRDGTLVTNITSVQLLFAYTEKSIF